MCGIAGFLGPAGEGPGLEARARHMADSLLHRGPGDGGSWADGEAGIGIGHRRLAVLDLSAAGIPSRVAANRPYVLSDRGAVYNAAYMRGEGAGAGPPLRDR